MSRITDEALDQLAQRTLARRRAPARTGPVIEIPWAEREMVETYGKAALEEVSRFEKGGPLPVSEPGLRLLEIDVLLDWQV